MRHLQLLRRWVDCYFKGVRLLRWNYKVEVILDIKVTLATLFEDTTLTV